MAISAILLHHPLHVLNSQSVLRFIRLCGLYAAMLHSDRILFGVLYFHPDQVMVKAIRRVILLSVISPQALTAFSSGFSKMV